MNKSITNLILLLLVILLGLSACRSAGGIRSIGSSPIKEVNRLLDNGDLDQAVTLVMAEDTFFSTTYGDENVRKTVERLASALDAAYSPRLQEMVSEVEAMEWPAPVKDWKSIKRKLEQFKRQLADFRRTPPFQYTVYRPDSYDHAFVAVKAKEMEIQQEASEAFAGYPLMADTSFFSAYPYPIDGREVMQANSARWTKALDEFSKEETEFFLAEYGRYLPKSAKKILASRYFKSFCPNPETASLKEILNAYEKCREADLQLASIPGTKIAFLQVTSPDLIKNKQLDFPLSVKLDVPFDASKASMRKMFSHEAVKGADIVILVNIALAKVHRVTQGNERISSMFIKAYRQEENPEYAIVKTELESAASQYHAARSESDFTWGASMVKDLIFTDDKEKKTEKAKLRMDELKEILRTTPKYRQMPDYQPYDVTKAFLDIYKTATVNYYVIDKRNRRYFRDTFDYKEKAFFTVCYDMHGSDRNKERLLQTSVLEEDVVAHELEPVSVNLSDLLGQYVNSPSSWKKYSSMETIHRSVAADVSRSQQTYRAKRYEYDKYHDKRFDSVVVVRNLGKGIGSGFYVTDDLVLTNYHVVDENEYVRLKLFNEREIMGRVIARDAQLDLALIQADVRGRPVCFYNKRTLPLGEMLEIIGHPNGLQFSITRGVISSVRKLKSITYAESKGKVLYIQTDVAANGGNSGGPAFMGNRVVGVVDWGFKRLPDGSPADGLNFTIHYSEVFKFLERHGINVCKRSK